MKRELRIAARCRRPRMDPLFFQRVTAALLGQFWPRHAYDLDLVFLGDRRMAALNRAYLDHAGPTDVITFDYNENGAPDRLEGEAFIGLGVAVRQAAEFGTTWQEEAVRYAAHALLHLDGYDDRAPADRRKMKRREDLLTRWMQSHFDLRRVAREGGS